MSVFSDAFVNTLIQNAHNSTVSNYNFVKVGPTDTANYVFSGYPQGDYLRQVCIVISMWNQVSRFPIWYKQLGCLQKHDVTETVTEMLDKLTT